jgi:hypothetical protein
VLGPALRIGDVLVMDNLGSHSIDGVRKGIVAKGATVL